MDTAHAAKPESPEAITTDEPPEDSGLPAPPPRKPAGAAKPKFTGPVEKECYGDFREDAPEEKKDECFVCSKYIDCIQISFKAIRVRRDELGKLAGLLRRRELALATEAGAPTTRSGRLLITPAPASGRRAAISASA